jgi:malate dehydrogenase
MAYAAYVFGEACMKAMNGYAGVEQCAYVESDIEGCSFFAQRVKLGRSGVVHKYGVGCLSAGEKDALKAMGPQLAEEIAKGHTWTK